MGPNIDLDALRRNSGIRLDGQGRWWHAEGPVEHERVAELFDNGLRVDEDGGVSLHVGGQWCWVEVEDTAYFVRRARRDGERFVLALNDGSEEELEPATLVQRGDDALYCRVKGGAHPARLLRSAYYEIAAALEPLEDGGIALRCGEMLHTVGTYEECGEETP